MGFSTKDIGGGIQQLVYTPDSQSQQSGLDAVKDRMGLVELGQRIELGGLDKKLKQNQIDMQPIANARAEAEKEAALIGVKRAKTEQMANAYTSMMNAYAINPVLGDQIAMANGMKPGHPSKDGSVTLEIPGSNGRTHAFSIFPGQETDPTKMAANANSIRDEWTEGSKGYVVVDSAWKTAQRAAQFKTGAGDAGLVASAARSLNPTEALNKGDIELVNTSNLGNYFKNLYNKNKDGDAPFLTDQERTNLLELTQLRHQVTKDATIALGRSFGQIASNPRLGIKNKEDVFISRGSLTVRDLFPEEYAEKQVGPFELGDSAEMHLTNQPGGQRKPAPIEAGIPRGAQQSEPPVRKRKEPRYTVDEDGLNKMLGDGAKDFMKGPR